MECNVKTHPAVSRSLSISAVSTLVTGLRAASTSPKTGYTGFFSVKARWNLGVQYGSIEPSYVIESIRPYTV